MTAHFCGRCGAAKASQDDRFCKDCGAPSSSTDSEKAATPQISAAISEGSSGGPVLNMMERTKNIILTILMLLGLIASTTFAQTPVGNVPPPTGMQWQLDFHDDFNLDSSINMSLWNGGPGGPNVTSVSWCPTSGYGDYATCGQQYNGVSINSTNGLQLVPTMGCNSSTNWGNSSTPPCGPASSVQTYNIYQPKLGKGVYFEWYAKMPHDNAGEGDGLHPDLWLTVPGRTMTSNIDEIDVAENQIGPGTLNHVHFNVFDNNNNLASIAVPATSVGDLSQADHAYGLLWVNTGVGQGSIQMYFDGTAQSGPISLNDAGWANGVYIENWIDPCAPDFWGSGRVCDSTTNPSADPLIVQHVRVWQAISSTSTPTPSATAIPLAAPTPNPNGVSSNGTFVPQNGPSITDYLGNIWTIVGGSIAENGVVEKTTFNVVELVYCNGYIYQKNTSDRWYRRSPVAGQGWYAISAPPCAVLTATPASTTTPSATPTPSPVAPICPQGYILQGPLCVWAG